MRLPDLLRDEWRCDPEWLAALPRLVGDCATRWQLMLEEPFDTPRSLVVPAGDVVLKLSAPSHFEAAHEADALATWAGRGAARLVARDDDRRALLIERCRPGKLLGDVEEESLAVVTALLSRLECDAGAAHPFRALADEADRWIVEVPERYARGGRPFEGSLVSFAVDVFRTVDRSATSVVNQDLHCGNILSAEREPWLVIDPKPLVGEREVSAVGLLRSAARRGGRKDVRRWLDALAEIGLDRERMRAWGCAHVIAWGWDEEEGWSRSSVEVARAIRAA